MVCVGGVTATHTYVYDFTEGDRSQSALLGGKGANLAEMTRLGLPVPPGFTITTEACRVFLETGASPAELPAQIESAIGRLESSTGRMFGSIERPLLVSVRSGAKFSMPGMMETVLNVGLNDATVEGLARASSDRRFAYDSYRRLIQMFGKTVLGISGHQFELCLDKARADAGVASDSELSADQIEQVVARYKEIIEERSGSVFPQDPRAQLAATVTAVFASWNTERAVIYRRREDIPDDLGTAVNICTMVFGNLGHTSGTGVCFTRDPATGHRGSYGDYLPNAQGEDVVAGIRNTLSLDEMKSLDPAAHDELLRTMDLLESHYRDLCDIEFTVEQGTLWMLQTRIGKRTPAAAFRIAIQLVDEGVISMDEAVMRVTGAQLTQLMYPQFDPESLRTHFVTGMAASPGAAVGRAVFDSATAEEWADRGEKVILVRRETNPDDLGGMIAAEGILTSRGGKTSHAAVVARGMGRTCVAGADQLVVESDARRASANGTMIVEGDVISIDGSSGEVYLGAVPVIESPVARYLEFGLEAGLAGLAESDADLVRAVHRVMEHADATRRMRVRANADNGADAARSVSFGAEGIGLCRTEHMFLGDRRIYVERIILASTQEEQQRAIDALLELQRPDFIEILEAMGDRPVTIRLLDPPLHEFLPDRAELMVRTALAERDGNASAEDLELLAAVNRLHESNPMLGLRGVRLGLVIPGLYVMQTRALAEAVCEVRTRGGNPHAEIMVPLVGSAHELRFIRASIEEVLESVGRAHGMELDLPIGTMIELPRAALRAGSIAARADFFSFGTNDLTQTTWGFSRDDVEAAFFAAYLSMGVFTVSPFETLDEIGVGRLVEIAVDEGRGARPGMKMGVCGEHGGDPRSIHFFHRVGLDYVSCSPLRVPVARLEAGRATLAARTSTSGSA
jgi:pyruvate,orthophosphate dikinase